MVPAKLDPEQVRIDRSIPIRLSVRCLLLVVNKEVLWVVTYFRWKFILTQFPRGYGEICV